MSLSSRSPNTPANDAQRVGEVARAAELPSPGGRLHRRLRIHVFIDEATGLEHVALVAGDVFKQERLASRHSGFGARVFQRLGTESLSLLEEDRQKIRQLSGTKLPVLSRIPQFIGPGLLDRSYLESRAKRSRHPLYPDGIPEA